MIDWFFETRFHCTFGACPGTSSCRPGWPQTHKAPPASQMLGLKACTTTAGNINFILKYKTNKQTNKKPSNLKKEVSAGSGGSCLQSQYLWGRVRQISEFEARVVYKASFRTAWATQRNPVSKQQKQKKILSSLYLFQLPKTMLLI